MSYTERDSIKLVREDEVQAPKERSISASSICKILEACKVNGVAVFEHGALKVSFYTPGEWPGTWRVGNREVKDPTSSVAEEAARTIEQEEFAQATEHENKRRLDDLLLEDPARFEELLVEGELQDEQPRTDDFESA